MDQARRLQVIRTIRQLGGGVSDFSNGKTRLYFPIRAKEVVEQLLTRKFGAPLAGQLGEIGWWCEELQVHVMLVKGRNDFYVSIPSTGGQVKGVFQ